MDVRFPGSFDFVWLPNRPFYRNPAKILPRSNGKSHQPPSYLRQLSFDHKRPCGSPRLQTAVKPRLSSADEISLKSIARHHGVIITLLSVLKTRLKSEAACVCWRRTATMTEKYRYSDGEYGYESQNGSTPRAVNDSGRPGGYDDEDVFGHEEGHDVRIPDSNPHWKTTTADTVSQTRLNTKPSAGLWSPSS